MREELTRPQWRKVAGEILSSDLEQSVEAMIRRSSGVEISGWELGDIGGERVRKIEAEMREIFVVRGKT